MFGDRHLYKNYLIFVWITIQVQLAMAQHQNIVFSHDLQNASLPVSSVDSMKVMSPTMFGVFVKGDTFRVKADTVYFHHPMSDTLIVDFRSHQVFVSNPRLDIFHIKVQHANVEISAKGKKPFVCLARGESDNGRLVIHSDTVLTLVLDNLHLSSQEGSAVCFSQKQKAIIELPRGSSNVLCDAVEYNPSDTTDTSNACLYGKGSLVFRGKGTLSVKGSFHHAIASSKNIIVEDGNITIENAKKNGIHCDKLTMQGGKINLFVANDGAKGIKCKESFIMTGGTIEGEAIGNAIIKDGVITYCSLIKCDGSMTVGQGNIMLTHQGVGGRCVSVDGNMDVKNSHLTMENHGYGGSYLDVVGDSVYFTPKCITVNGTMRIERGQVKLLATGSGGKGIDCSDSLLIGYKGDGFLEEDSLTLSVETSGSALVDNYLKDYRRGCPKGIKSDTELYIYSGTLHITTHGQGGEGIESKGSLRAYKTTVIADCYDDCINTGLRCYIDGAHIFCVSSNNDGIDSNGKCTIMDGVVAAISEHFEDESIDTEGGRLHIYGGIFIGIGNDEVEVSEQSVVPSYSTHAVRLENGRHYGDSIAIGANNTLSLVKRHSYNDSSTKVVDAIISIHHKHASPDAFITVAAKDIGEDDALYLLDGDMPRDTSSEWFNGLVTSGGYIDITEDALQGLILIK